MIQQDLFQQIVESGGKDTETCCQALDYIRQKCRTEGIDAALQDKKIGENFDALVLFDRKGAGQQLAAQAGKDFQRLVPPIFPSFTLSRHHTCCAIFGFLFLLREELHAVDAENSDFGLVHYFPALHSCPMVLFSLTVNRLSDCVHTNRG